MRSYGIRICALAAAFGAAAFASTAFAAKEIKIGVIFDYTGPLAAGGSKAAAVATKIAIDMINEKGGVDGYKIVPIYADAQSKVDVAINEATRLIDEQHVNMLMGFYSSAQCVPIAQKADAQKLFTWFNVCISSSVFKGKNLHYVFRAQLHSDQVGQLACEFVNAISQPKLHKAPKDLRVAIIHEDGPYGSGVAAGNSEACGKDGMNIVLKEGYSATAPDLSSLVTKLRRARPDVILHTGYSPDITLFWRQAREQGLKWNALIGQGAGYGQYDKLHSALGDEANYIFNVDPVAAQLLDPKTLKPGLGDLTKEMIKRYKAATGAQEVPPHASMGFNQAWIFFTDVMPRAIKKYGGITSEDLRKAALDTDIPIGGTIQGYGVKFFPPGSAMSGQNERSSPVVMQYLGGKTKIVFPKALRTADPVIPLPKSSAYAK